MMMMTMTVDGQELLCYNQTAFLLCRKRVRDRRVRRRRAWISLLVVILHHHQHLLRHQPRRGASLFLLVNDRGAHRDLDRLCNPRLQDKDRFHRLEELEHWTVVDRENGFIFGNMFAPSPHR